MAEQHTPELVDNGAFAQAKDKINLTPDASAESISALDALAAEVMKPAEEAAPAGPAKPAEPAAAAEPAKPAEAPAAGEQPLVQPKEGATPKPGEGAAAGAPAKDDFDAIQLPPHTKPKSAEAFDAVKKMAREKVTTLSTQVGELTTRAEAAEKELTELKGKADQLPENVQAELEDLRKFKLGHDVESDPTFTQFKTDLGKNQEAILAKLKTAGINEENLAKIKEIGLDNLDWEPVLAKLPLQTRRYVEAKLVENITLAEKRDAALATAKENAQGFLKERSGREAKQLLEATNNFTKQIPWTAEQKIPANATPEQKAHIESENKFAKDMMANLQGWIQAKTPEQIAELAVGTMIAYRNKRDLEALHAKHTAFEKSKGDEIAALTKERDALKTELDSIKNRQVPKNLSGGVTPVTTKAPKAGAIDIRSGEDAFAEYEKEMAKRD